MTVSSAAEPLAAVFERFLPQARRVLEEIAPASQVEGLLRSAREAFAGLIPEMPYTDRRDHLMWEPTLAVFQWLAVHLATREAGIDAHALGRAMLDQMAAASDGGGDERAPADLVTRAPREAAESQSSAAENEFVFELVPGDDHSDFGMNITRCAVCHAYARHDAMDLVPYMCASDDVVSDRLGQGLRRTGTIALGAHHCDFRYRNGGDPLRLAEQYPDRIRLARSEDQGAGG